MNQLSIPDVVEPVPDLLVDRTRGRVSWVWSQLDDPFRSVEAVVVFWNEKKQRLGSVGRFHYN